MTISIYEFFEIDPVSGDAVYPPDKIRKGLALDAAHKLNERTKVLEIVANTNVHVSLTKGSVSTDLATTTDRRMDSGEQRLVTISQKTQDEPKYISATAAT